ALVEVLEPRARLGLLAFGGDERLQAFARLGIRIRDAAPPRLAAELVVQPRLDALVQLLELLVGEVVERVLGEELARQLVVDVAQLRMALEPRRDGFRQRVSRLGIPIAQDDVDAAGATERLLDALEVEYDRVIPRQEPAEVAVDAQPRGQENTDDGDEERHHQNDSVVALHPCDPPIPECLRRAQTAATLAEETARGQSRRTSDAKRALGGETSLHQREHGEHVANYVRLELMRARDRQVNAVAGQDANPRGTRVRIVGRIEHDAIRILAVGVGQERPRVDEGRALA